MQFNNKISLDRANSVKDYLLRKGVKIKQLKVLGAGSSMPLTKDKNADDSWNKESMAFNRRIEFKVIKQGTKTLKILPITGIPDQFLLTK